MGDAQQNAATQILTALDDGGDAALANDLMPLVYDDLRRMAAAHVRGRDTASVVQPTAIVHEAYLRLIDQSRVQWRGRTHFLAIGAQMVRRVLVDEARTRRAQKRGGGQVRLSLHDATDVTRDTPAEICDLDDALSALAIVDQRAAKVVEMRFFAGMSELEIAEILGISERTVRNDWRMARAWLRRALRGGGEDGGET